MRKSAPSKDTLTLHFNVIVEGQSDGKHVAHCLELDLVAEGSTAEEACTEILNVIDVHVRTCMQNDNLENLFFPAPKEVWDKLGAIKARTSQYTHETVKRNISDDRHRRNVEVDQYCYA